MTKELGDIGFGYRPRAPYACDPAKSRGRFQDEPESPTRTPFQRDRDRIIHSTAFRRLKHKTQVFVAHEGDHYRTRLTHSIEVAQIARALARALRCDEDLAEAIALVHDFGHTPFGHTGEDALNAKMAKWGGFDHNAQSLRVVTRLERRYAEFDGLNLTWETLEGLVKHNGPLTDARGKGLKGPVPQAIRDFSELFDLELDRHAGLEAQCAAIADDIAYNTHDIDDGLRAGLLTLDMLDTVGAAGVYPEGGARALPGARCRAHRARADAPPDHHHGRGRDCRHEGQSRSGQAAEPRRRPVGGRDDRRVFAGLAADEKELKAFLYKNMYRADEVMRVRAEAEQVVLELFDAYFADPRKMPDGWREGLDRAEDRIKARDVADFLAGMTDTYALKEHRRLFDHTPDLG